MGRLLHGLVLVLTVSASFSAPLEDIIESLPDYGQPPTTQFSGYLDASEGCDTLVNGPICKLHYWLSLAKDDPWDAPVILWLNGGPGSSSILGLLQENGPLLIDADGGLMDNPWSWTNVANLLILEAPIGVGYSYCSKQFDGKPCQNTDKYTASASRAALVDFFENKFPELAGNDFFITGESYAGVYVPTLAQSILLFAPSINLVGIAVGDPCTDNTAQQDSMDALWYAGKYGLVDDAIFDKLWNECGVRSPTVQALGGKNKIAAELNRQIREADHKSVDSRRRLAASLLLGTQIVQEHDSPECTLALRKFLLSSSHALSQWWGDLFIDDYSLFAPVTEKQDEDMAEYMMRTDVRKALHTEEAPTGTWPDVDIGFDYTSEYDACNADAEEGALSMIDIYREIAPKLEVTWVYNGDTDPCVSYEGTRTAMKRVGFEELDGGGYRPWFYDQDSAPLEVLAVKAPLFGPNLLAQDVGAQMGGHIVNYENSLSFVTFHGSGHMVPQFRPQAALHFISKLVTYAELAPLLPRNSTLLNMTDEEFGEALDSWTESAMEVPYLPNDHY